MSYAYDPMMPVAYARADERAAFIRRTYLHVAGALAACAGVLAVIFGTFGAEGILRFFYGGTVLSPNVMMLILMFGFMGAGWLAQSWARSPASSSTQYLGLGLFVVAQAVILAPILAFASIYAPGVIAEAGVLTLCLAAGLTMAVFLTRKDFSFLIPIVSIASWVMIGLIVISFFFSGLQLGAWFSVLGIGVASAAILYQTSNIMNHYSYNMHVAAALEVFSSIAMLFFYILRLLLEMRSR
jgi:FtsH-binding integral membrane protein